MKKSFVKIAGIIAFVSGIALVACGDDSSDGLPAEPSVAPSELTSSESQAVESSVSENPAVETSSESTPEEPIAPIVAEESSASVETPAVGGYVPGTLEEEIAKDAPFVAASAANATLQPLADVYASLQPTERVIFVLRHARRGSSSTQETPLHNTGVVQSQELGAMIADGTPIFYAHSDYVRTRQTALNIFAGRGGDTTQFVSTVVDKLAGGGYVKDSDLISQYAEADFNKNQLKVFASWMYKEEYSDAFNDLTETSVAFLTQHILPAFPADYRVGIMISHDMTVAPLVAYCAALAVDFKAYESLAQWLGYLQGLAIIIDENGNRRYVPVNGLYGTYAYLDGVNQS